MNYSEATISIRLSNDADLALVQNWANRWERDFLQHLEAVRYGERIYQVVVPKEALCELPQRLYRTADKTRSEFFLG